HAHRIAAPMNVFLSKRVPGKLKTIGFDMDDVAVEEDMSLGDGKVEDFDQYQLPDFCACVECGRCADVCPAARTGGLLSPLFIMIKLRDHLTEKGAAITGKTPWVPSYVFSNTTGNLAASGAGEAAATVESINMIGDVITEEEISACTTCRAC